MNWVLIERSVHQLHLILLFILLLPWRQWPFEPKKPFRFKCTSLFFWFMKSASSSKFCCGWTHHSLKAEQGKTFQQLWIDGPHHITNLNDLAVTGLHECKCKYKCKSNVILVDILVSWWYISFFPYAICNCILIVGKHLENNNISTKDWFHR